MFLSQTKNTFKITTTVTLVIMLFQFFYYIALTDFNKDFGSVNKKTVLGIASINLTSPFNVENNHKKIERPSINETSGLNDFSLDKQILSDNVSRSQKLQLLYTLSIQDQIKLLQIIANHLDQRSPPLFLS